MKKTFEGLASGLALLASLNGCGARTGLLSDAEMGVVNPPDPEETPTVQCDNQQVLQEIAEMQQQTQNMLAILEDVIAKNAAPIGANGVPLPYGDYNYVTESSSPDGSGFFFNQDLQDDVKCRAKTVPSPAIDSNSSENIICSYHHYSEGNLSTVEHSMEIDLLTGEDLLITKLPHSLRSVHPNVTMLAVDDISTTGYTYYSRYFLTEDGCFYNNLYPGGNGYLDLTHFDEIQPVCRQLCEDLIAEVTNAVLPVIDAGKAQYEVNKNK